MAITNDPRRYPLITDLLGSDLRQAPGLEEAEVWYAHLASDRAVAVWEQILASRETHGFYPVLCSDLWPETTAEELLGRMPTAGDVTYQTIQATFAEADQFPFPVWLDKQRDPVYQTEKNLEMARHFETMGESGQRMAGLYRGFADTYRSVAPWQFRAEDYPWPDVEPPPRHRSQLHTLRELREPWGQFHAKPEVGMLLVHAQHALEVPARLQFGGFNDCPSPPVHVAFLRWMNERFGSELIGTCGDALEITLSRRPMSREDALRLACDLEIYAEEPEHGDWKQGQLAAFLMHTDVIYFWWD